ncbi:MAG: TonB-dependent receptor, partial [Marinirhabdus sp.]|nr:TonB-dependent receptor [Marinirhabdus sp.]
MTHFQIGFYIQRILKKQLFSALLLSLPFLGYAQEEEENIGTEVVNIVRPYTPSISDAFKVRETPQMNDSVSLQKQKVQYQIFSVPVASTFTPAKGKAETVERAKPIKLYDNYATLGFGNYTTIFGELYSNFEISRTDNAGFFFRHNSSQGGIDGVVLDNKYYDTQLDGNYTSRQRDITYRLDAGVQHQVFNWYGLNANYDNLDEVFLSTIDATQTYVGGYLGGSVALEDSYFEKITANVRYLGDAYGSSEFNFRATPEFSFPLTTFNLQINGTIDYLSGAFEKQYLGTAEVDHNVLIAGVSPSLEYINNDLSLSLGVSAFVGMELDDEASSFYLYPNIEASYRLVDELLMVYGGVDGGLSQNSFYGMKEENPFVSPTLALVPTSQLYNGFGGLKGKLTNNIGYNIRGSYGLEENKALFRNNPDFGNGTADLEGYEYGNSFGLVYDDVNTLSIFGELTVAASEKFNVGLSAEYFSYTTDTQTQAWNLPD